MSGGKKRKYTKRTYTEGELRHIIHKSRDDVVVQMMYLFINAVTDMFEPTEDQLVEFMAMVQRYNEYISSGLVDYKVAVDSIEKTTGVKLNLSRWG